VALVIPRWADPVTLQGTRVTLTPLSPDHHDDLVQAVKDGELWKLWYTFVPPPEQMGSEIDRRLYLQVQGLMLPFTVIDRATGMAVGMTTLHIDVTTVHLGIAGRRLEIGSTWYCQRMQRTHLNTECKYLLLTHAFEALDCIAVQFTTSFFNHRSRRAIERLGAKLDGVLRSHMILADGVLRDTCVYSIVRSEWPAVKAHLTWQRQRP